MDRQNSKLSCRDCIKMSLLGAGSLALGGFIIGWKCKFTKSKLNVALIGGGGIAQTAFKDCREENVVAIADVDNVLGAPGFDTFPDTKRYRDWRKLLDVHYKELDLVPDHTHFAST